MAVKLKLLRHSFSKWWSERGLEICHAPKSVQLFTFGVYTLASQIHGSRTTLSRAGRTSHLNTSNLVIEWDVVITLTLWESGRVHFAVVGGWEYGMSLGKAPSNSHSHTHTNNRLCRYISTINIPLDSVRKKEKKRTHNRISHTISISIYTLCRRYPTCPSSLPHSPTYPAIWLSTPKYPVTLNMIVNGTTSGLPWGILYDFILSQGFFSRASCSGWLCGRGGVDRYRAIRTCYSRRGSRTLLILLYENRYKEAGREGVFMWLVRLIGYNSGGVYSTVEILVVWSSGGICRWWVKWGGV